jgi:hypothetical protein
MKERFGEWECPEGIKFGTPLEEMPKHIQTKISSYKSRMIEKGREEPKIEQKDRIGSAPMESPKKISFTQTPGCTHRFMCVECRNNEKFREKMENQLGPWECPENIPIGTPLAEMPEKIQEIHRKREEQIKVQKEKMEKIRIALDGIEEVIPEQALGLIDVVRAHIFPDTKKASICKYNTGEKKKIEQKCCGGKVKKVDGFICSKHGDVSDRRCRACQDFESKR